MNPTLLSPLSTIDSPKPSSVQPIVPMNSTTSGQFRPNQNSGKFSSYLTHH